MLKGRVVKVYIFLFSRKIYVWELKIEYIFVKYEIQF